MQHVETLQAQKSALEEVLEKLRVRNDACETAIADYEKNKLALKNEVHTAAQQLKAAQDRAAQLVTKVCSRAIIVFF